MRLLDRVTARYRAQGYYEGMASGAAVLMTYTNDPKKEPAVKPLVAAATQAYETNGVVFACTLVRMMMLAEAAFKFRSLVDKRLFGNPDLRILEYPWPNATAGELWARMEQQSSLTGNAFVAKVAVDELLVLPSAEVTIVSEVVVSPSGTRYKRPLGYDWDPSLADPAAKSKAQFFTVDEVAHWSPIPDPVAQFRGMSWLTPVLRDVNADSAMTNYKSMYMDHGSPIVAVKYTRPLKPETVDSLMERIQAKYGGVANAFKPLIFDQGADPMMGGGLADIDYRNVQTGGETRICAAAGVSPVLVGLRNAEPGESYETAMRQLADMHLRPLWRSACASLQKLVPNVPAQGVQLWYDTSDIAALQAAETEKAQVTQVNSAAILTFVQAGFTRDSILSAVTSGDLSLLVSAPEAPPPGITGRETITDAIGGTAAGAKLGQAAGVQPVLTKPQTPASKMPMPASIPTTPSATGRPRAPSANGKG
jgi:phage portal protein BeeE